MIRLSNKRAPRVFYVRRTQLPSVFYRLLKRFLKLSLGLYAVESVAAPPAPNELPTGAQIIAGSSTLNQTGNQLNITQSSQRAIINFNTFNIGAQASVNVAQPNNTAAALYRVTSGAPSQIYGSLTSNGQVFLTNSAGAYFAQGAVVNTGSFLATTYQIQDSDFMAGNYRFSRSGSTASLSNYGSITAANGGFVALLGQNISNQGLIRANLGKIVLAGGETTTLQIDGQGGLLSVQIDPATVQTLIDNKGMIDSGGGTVILTAQSANQLLNSAVSNEGIISAQSMVNQGGTIQLIADTVLNSGKLDVSNQTASNTPGGSILLNAFGNNSGTVMLYGTSTLDASSYGSNATGGTINILGDRIALLSGATIRATGTAGGGTVLIGGDAHGSGPNPNASKVIMQQGATIDASATKLGKGGQVVLWSQNYTDFEGTILAKGGTDGGDGGFIETSSHGILQVLTGSGNATAPQGKSGQWLLDPEDVTIIAGSSSTGGSLDGSNIWQPNTSIGTIGVSTITDALALGQNVTIQTGSSTDGLGGSGNITVATPIVANMSSLSATLSLNAVNNITVNAGSSITASGAGGLLGISISASSGSITLLAPIVGDIGSVNLTAGSNIILSAAITANNDITASTGLGQIIVSDNISSTNGGVALTGNTLVLGNTTLSAQNIVLSGNSGSIFLSTSTVIATQLDLLGNAAYSLNNLNNLVQTIAANAGSINFVSSTNLTVGSFSAVIGGISYDTVGITTSGAVSLLAGNSTTIAGLYIANSINTNGGNLTLANSAGGDSNFAGGYGVYISGGWESALSGSGAIQLNLSLSGTEQQGELFINSTSASGIDGIDISNTAINLPYAITLLGQGGVGAHGVQLSSVTMTSQNSLIILGAALSGGGYGVLLNNVTLSSTSPYIGIAGQGTDGAGVAFAGGTNIIESLSGAINLRASSLGDYAFKFSANTVSTDYIGFNGNNTPTTGDISIAGNSSVGLANFTVAGTHKISGKGSLIIGSEATGNTGNNGFTLSGNIDSGASFKSVTLGDATTGSLEIDDLFSVIPQDISIQSNANVLLNTALTSSSGKIALIAGSTLTLNQGIAASAIVLSTTQFIQANQTSISATLLDLLGSSDYTLTGSSFIVKTLAGNAGSLNFVGNGTALTVGQFSATIAGQSYNTIGITTQGDLSLIDTNGALSIVSGALTSISGNLALAANSLNLSAAALSAQNIILSAHAGSVSAIGTITAAQLGLFGQADYTFANINNVVQTLAASAHSLNFFSASNLTVGSVSAVIAGISYNALGITTSGDLGIFVGSSISPAGIYIANSINTNGGDLSLANSSAGGDSNFAGGYGVSVSGGFGSALSGSGSIQINFSGNNQQGSLTINSSSASGVDGIDLSNVTLNVSNSVSLVGQGGFGATGIQLSSVTIVAANNLLILGAALSGEGVGVSFSDVTLSSTNQSIDIFGQAQNGAGIAFAGGTNIIESLSGSISLTAISTSDYAIKFSKDSVSTDYIGFNGSNTPTTGDISIQGDSPIGLANFTVSGTHQIAGQGSLLIGSETSGNAGFSLSGTLLPNNAFKSITLGDATTGNIELDDALTASQDISVNSSGSLSVNSTVTSSSGRIALLAGNVLTLSQAVSASAVVISASQFTATGQAGLSATLLDLLGSNNYTLTGSSYSVQTLAGNVGSLNYAGSSSTLTIGQFSANIAGISYNTLGLTSQGDLSIANNSGDLIILSGTNIASTSGNIALLAANTLGLNAASLSAQNIVLSANTGNVSLSGAINASQLALLGNIGYTLTNSNNIVQTLAASAQSVNFVSSSNLTIGTVSLVIAGVSYSTVGINTSGDLSLTAGNSISAAGLYIANSIFTNGGNLTLANSSAGANSNFAGGYGVSVEGGFGPALTNSGSVQINLSGNLKQGDLSINSNSASGVDGIDLSNLSLNMPGNLTLAGQGGTGAHGVVLSTVTITSNSGNLFILGVAMSGNGNGVSLNDVTLSSTTGTISIFAEADAGPGIAFTGGTNVIQSLSGAISLTSSSSSDYAIKFSALNTSTDFIGFNGSDTPTAGSITIQGDSPIGLANFTANGTHQIAGQGSLVIGSEGAGNAGFTLSSTIAPTATFTSVTLGDATTGSIVLDDALMIAQDISIRSSANVVLNSAISSASGGIALLAGSVITINQAISASAVVLSAAGLTETNQGGISATLLNLLGTNNYNLSESFNNIQTLAGKVGSLSFAGNSSTLTIGQFSGSIAGMSYNTAGLTSQGDINITNTSGGLTIGNVLVSVSGGIALAANTLALDAATLSAKNIILSANSGNVTAASIRASQLGLLGQAAYTLTKASNVVQTLAASAQSIHFVSSSNLTIGSISSVIAGISYSMTGVSTSGDAVFIAGSSTSPAGLYIANSISTNGGNLSLANSAAGGNSNFALGYGVAISGGLVSALSNSGALQINLSGSNGQQGGLSINSTSASGVDGLDLQNMTLTMTGSASLSLIGKGGANAQGVVMSNTLITVEQGGVFISGTAGTGAGQGLILNNTTLSSIGGPISLNGQASSAAGIAFASGTNVLESLSGSISLTATSTGDFAIKFSTSATSTDLIGFNGNNASTTGNITIQGDSPVGLANFSAAGTHQIAGQGSLVIGSLNTGNAGFTLSGNILPSATFTSVTLGDANTGSIVLNDVIAPTQGDIGLRSSGNITVNTALNSQSGVVLAGNTLTINTTINAHDVVLSANTSVSETQQITAQTLQLLGSTVDYTITFPGNEVQTLAANTGSLNFANSLDLTIGSISVAIAGATYNTNGIIANQGGVRVFTSGTITVAPSATVQASNNSIVLLAAKTLSQIQDLTSFIQRTYFPDILADRYAAMQIALLEDPKVLTFASNSMNLDLETDSTAHHPADFISDFEKALVPPPPLLPDVDTPLEDSIASDTLASNSPPRTELRDNLSSSSTSKNNKVEDGISQSLNTIRSAMAPDAQTPAAALEAGNVANKAAQAGSVTLTLGGRQVPKDIITMVAFSQRNPDGKITSTVPKEIAKHFRGDQIEPLMTAPPPFPEWLTEPLPHWITFDKSTLTFSIENAPPNSLPITIIFKRGSGLPAIKMVIAEPTS